MVKKKTGAFAEIENGEICRTNKFFIALRSYGHCDEKGKTVLGVECSSKKLIAPPDKPLYLFSQLLAQLMPSMQYSSGEAMKEDLEKFQKWVADLKVSERT